MRVRVSVCVCVCERDTHIERERERVTLDPDHGGVQNPLAGMTNLKTRIPALCFQSWSASVKAIEKRTVKERDGARRSEEESARREGWCVGEGKRRSRTGESEFESL